MKLNHLSAVDVTAQLATADAFAPVRVGYTDEGDVVVVLDPDHAEVLGYALIDRFNAGPAKQEPTASTWVRAAVELLVSRVHARHVAPPVLPGPRAVEL